MAQKQTKNDTLSFKPKEVTKKLLLTVSKRAQDVLSKRYGLGKSADKMTLEAIGKEYNITRERVRQIENFSLNGIRKSEEYKNQAGVFNELKEAIDFYGGIVHEEEFLSSVAKDKNTQNHVHFLLVLSEHFVKLKEDDEFHHRWTTDQEVADRVHQSIKNVCNQIGYNDIVSEKELIASFLDELSDITKKFKTSPEELAKKWLSISKSLSANPLGEWGLSKSPNVRLRGIRDYAYLILREHGSPMHFTEVSKAIEQTFGKKAHPATCHNELIKDPRFVLVGRGLYALVEWGYTRGVVVDVIRAILEKEGPLTKEDIVNRVLKERHVKENTIVVNIQNPKHFGKDQEGKYFVIS